ncbi:S1C family serine protease [Neoactinobaculum massilliense]|uniref:S1C family serine protease n=1 Tax=Neoactinobaculum massilliense TaxID=2364794 RepID=UPI000F54AF3B|nr:S1C family serine protease [Neoactinobaculum massilliense]
MSVDGANEDRNHNGTNPGATDHAAGDTAAYPPAGYRYGNGTSDAGTGASGAPGGASTSGSASSASTTPGNGSGTYYGSGYGNGTAYGSTTGAYSAAGSSPYYNSTTYGTGGASANGTSGTTYGGSTNGYGTYYGSGYYQQTPGTNGSAAGGYPSSNYYSYPASPAVKQRKKHSLGLGWASVFIVLALILGALGGAGVSALDHRSQVQSLQNQITQLENQSQNNSGNGLTNPYMPSPQQSETPDSSGNASSDPVNEGTRVDNAPGVVLINVSELAGVGAGTGMVLTSDGQVLTNYHVVQGSSEVTVTVASTGKQYTATVVGHDETHDIALLQLQNASGLETVSIASSAASKGDKISVLGNSEGQGYLSKLTGTVTATNESILISDETGGDPTWLRGLIETDADVVPGYSGGPMFNSDGEVVGMNSAASVGETSSAVNGYAIPIESAMEIVKTIRAGKSTGDVVVGPNAALGITVGTSQSGNGVSVMAIDPSSNASTAGLERGDVITALNGESVNAASDLARSIRGFNIGDEVTLTVEKQTTGATETIKVKLVESTVN